MPGGGRRGMCAFVGILAAVVGIGLGAMPAEPAAAANGATAATGATSARSLRPHNCYGTNGYYLVGADGGVFAFCAARYYGSLANSTLSAPIVGMATNAQVGYGTYDGYYLVGADGKVYPFGDEPFFGSPAKAALRAPIVGMVVTHCVADVDPQCAGGVVSPDGYYLVGADGGVFTFGNAPYFGSLAGHRLNAPIVALVPYEASDCSGTACSLPDTGYYLVGADGGVFAFGDAPYVGSLARDHLNARIVGATSGPGGGLVLVAADGGTFSLGGAPYVGSLAGSQLDAPVVGVLSPGPDVVAADGGVFTLGSDGLNFAGSMAGIRLNAPIVGGADVSYFAGGG